jgi:hypothetical protein
MQKVFVHCMLERKKYLEDTLLIDKALVNTLLGEVFRTYDGKVVLDRQYRDDHHKDFVGLQPGMLQSSDVLGNMDSILLRCSILFQTVQSLRVSWEKKGEVFIKALHRVSPIVDALPLIASDIQTSNSVKDLLNCFSEFVRMREIYLYAKNKEKTYRNDSKKAVETYLVKVLYPVVDKYMPDSTYRNTFDKHLLQLKAVTKRFLSNRNTQFKVELCETLNAIEACIQDVALHSCLGTSSLEYRLKQQVESIQREITECNSLVENPDFPDILNELTTKIASAMIDTLNFQRPCRD